ncbi:sensor histidine kinase [Nocardioides xinjiangensis]|uniref:sensor histidine kinase n=1 Tax=Nocardioides xinjiangensis TaxID=2817376 RepID=UPI001B317781|nr:sensor histidine kinase [Nocardioides sp. SYSU D00514]
MSRTSRLLLVAAAWAVPASWVLLALLAGPSDGTALSSRLVPGTGPQWGDSVRVATTYGATPLQPGDAVQRIDGRPLADWLASPGDVRREVGDVVRYEVRRPGEGLDLVQEVEVTLGTYPVSPALRSSPHVPLLAALLLATGSVVFWLRSASASARAFLASTALLPAAVASTPFGTSVVDLAGGRGVWPRAGSEALAALGMVALVLSVALTTRPEGRARWTAGALAVVPLLGYAAWLAVRVGAASTAERPGVLTTVAAPALAAAVPALAAAAALAHARARSRGDVLATRLVLLGLAAGVGAWLVLGPLPALVGGAPLVRSDLLVLLAGGFVVACVAAAVARSRLEDVEPRVRRGLVQALVLAVVAAAFVGAARAVDVATDVDVGSVLAGGLLALLLLPVAVAVRRTVRRLVYGDREFPDRVVSDLRRLDAVTAPQDALREMLELLVRRLHLSYAAIDVVGTGASEPVSVSIGTAYGTPATIDLTVGGSTIGRLQVEVDVGHDPFGPGDRRLLEDVGTQVGALVQAVSTNRELQLARQRLVAAREEERRRLRRDLHDGLGPSLATLAMRLEGAADLVHEDPDRAADLVARLSDQTREGIAEVRRLVEGLRPPALDQLGLVSALRHRAAEHGSPTSAVAVPWTVEAEDDLEPLPAAVEVAAYRIVVEAVNNVQRHSEADRCTVRLARVGPDLRIEVVDTGRGLAPDRRAGVGLSSMRERAEELGGSIEVGPAAGGGTRVGVRLPLEDR